MHQPHLSARAIYRKICTFSDSKKCLPRTPSYSFVVNHVTNMPADLKMLAHEGNKKYDDIYELIFLRNANCSNDIWQADHTLLDIVVLDKNNNESRPWLSIVLDDKSRAIAGFYLTLSCPFST